MRSSLETPAHASEEGGEPNMPPGRSRGPSRARRGRLEDGARVEPPARASFETPAISSASESGRRRRSSRRATSRQPEPPVRRGCRPRERGRIPRCRRRLRAVATKAMDGDESNCPKTTAQRANGGGPRRGRPAKLSRRPPRGWTAAGRRAHPWPPSPPEHSPRVWRARLRMKAKRPCRPGRRSEL